MKTPKGTELPMVKIKGNDYLLVVWRIVWMREEHPDWTIKTTLIEHSPEKTIFKAEIITADGKLLATAHKHETKQDFYDHLEKAETSAIGRALALCGYGTQFAPELAEGDRLADSPVDNSRRPLESTIKASPARQVTGSALYRSEDLETHLEKRQASLGEPEAEPLSQYTNQELEELDGLSQTQFNTGTRIGKKFYEFPVEELEKLVRKYEGTKGTLDAKEFTMLGLLRKYVELKKREK